MAVDILPTQDLFPVEEMLYVDEMPADRLAHASEMPLRVPLTAGEVLGSRFENCHNLESLTESTVDLLLAMNPRQLPSPQADRADFEKHEHTRALTSPR